MGQELHKKIETWKKLLLDIGKGNRLINFKENKRSSVRITTPSYDDLFEQIVVCEKEIRFPYAKKIRINDEGEETYGEVIKGDVETSKPIGDLQKTLKVIRYRAKTSLEEQGVNTLFLAFGLLSWTEREDSEQIFSSPIVLVPVKLVIESLTSPYKLTLHEDEIVVNPTLLHKLSSDFGINLPEFDGTQDNITSYLDKIEQIISKKDWKVERCVHLTNLSFLKINMYKDLERNEEKLNSNPIIAAIVGERESIQVPEGFKGYNDEDIQPIDTFQVVDADSSQQDAILLSKQGVSFVLQGPPGTGKSQTITNIISEAIADGKRVLFVSEKMAALQVVYTRLEKVGLGDFCLTLHSHKANKKEILRELDNSTKIDRKKVTDEALYRLYTLEQKRAHLNKYQQELHTPCSKLNKSIFDINGQLAKLSDVPEVVFGIDNVDKITRQEFNDHCYLLRELSRTIGKQSENAWRNSTVKFLSNELRHNIDSNISTLLHLLSEAKQSFEDCHSMLNVTIDQSVDGLELLIKILKIAQNSPLIPTQWISDAYIPQLIADAVRYKTQREQIDKIQKELRDSYVDYFFDCDAEQIKRQLSEKLCILQTKVKSDSAHELAQMASKICMELSNLEHVLETLCENAHDIADSFGINKPLCFAQIKNLYALSEAVATSANITPTDKWFEISSLHDIELSLSVCKSFHEELASVKQSLLRTFDKEIFTQDFIYPMLQRFRSEYTSFLRVLRTDYRNDMRRLKQYISNDTGLAYKDALKMLNSLKFVSDKTKEIENKQELYVADYGVYYDGLETRWDTLQEALNLFEPILSVSDSVPSKLRNLYKTKSLPIKRVAGFNDLCRQYSLDGLKNEIASLLSLPINDDTPCEQIVIECKKSVSLLKEFIAQYEEVLKLRRNTTDYDTLLTDLSKLAFIQAEKKRFSEQHETLSAQYDIYYANEDTDWDKLIVALQFAKEFKELATEYQLSNAFVQTICTDENSVAFCQTELPKLTALVGMIDKPLQWFINLFDDSEPFRTYSLAKLIDRLVACKDKKYLLEEWVDYCTNKQKCEDSGLSSYIAEFEAKAINPDYLVEAYSKRFYHLWLDAILPQFPEVLNFRGRIHEQIINEFRQLDKDQFEIAQARVRERVVSRMPDFNGVTSTRDEIGILKRELNKRQRLMPLRKLFMVIPNLITSLRPCFMMSPLSVSIFLEAQSYDFDLVIFDEASQVRTEDAIGAIMRGKQAIIVGDKYQLPPTNFFTASLNDEDFDNDEDNDAKNNDSRAFDSILEEAETVLPQKSLCWHYRSRHEHLIAFSNIKIYENKLITFPASVEKAPDCGVEYIHVLNGIYDRSGKRNNVIEAQKVAELVFEHFRKYPKRSLGVVTFSEAQQNAVDAAIRQKRYQNNAFEHYFSENKDEPFFIKNLENVQGDERDTIIFSIGYAKDIHGVMYMNFGPLSRDEGYRRLNVAITRAKYNVKLVGSIAPADIDIEKTSAEGVKMLRSYIEFAQNGMTVLEKESTSNNKVIFESPFEESVYDFLQTKGYNVATQVGCSGFRIDMAIKHPTYSGRFAIGIECDGATYHSSKTARDRDRLRQTVLEDMGWTIYRIWSTDWIKDPKTEGEKLVAAVEKALKRDISDENAEPSNAPTETVVIEEPITEAQHGYGFIEYQQANINDYYQLSTEDIIKKVIEIEQPIHFEELCRRVAPLYGNQKATSKIRNEVQRVFRYRLSNAIKQSNEFITLVDFNNLQVRIPGSHGDSITSGENYMSSAACDYIRPISYICSEELALAMNTIVARSFGITPENLFVETARVFGFKHTGKNIVSSLRRIYDSMLTNGQIEEIDGKVRNT